MFDIRYNKSQYRRMIQTMFDIREEFRKQFKEENSDNKSVSVVGKAGGAKWKSLTDDEKAPYVQKAKKRKIDYTKKMNDYNLKLANGRNSDKSDKSKSEFNDEDEDVSGKDEDED